MDFVRRAPNFKNILDYEHLAQAKMNPNYFNYYFGGAGDSLSLTENRNVYSRIKLRPRVLRDVTERDKSINILGSASSMPLMIAPTALAQLAHQQGELGLAEAAKKHRIIFCASALSNYSIHEISQKAGDLWLQLYLFRDRNVTENLIQKAVDSGCSAIVVTVDAPVLGLRENLSQLELPENLSLGNFDLPNETNIQKIFQYFHDQIDPSIGWMDLQWLVEHCPIPILLKGILRDDDAQRAYDCGAKGIIVSNHGGRQLDTAITGLEALPEIASRVGKKMFISVDGGIRRGTDVLKALALGAHAVCVGRPVLWGLAVNGAEGVDQILSILAREFDIAMALCGCGSMSEITDDLLFLENQSF